MTLQVYLEKARGLNRLDLSDLLLRDGTVTITQETERGAYERVVSDCTIDLSDMDGTLGDTFAGARNTDRWYLRLVADNRQIFYGPVKPQDVERSTIEERLRITAFSMERAFWDGAEKTKAGPHIGLGMSIQPTFECTLEYMFTRDLLKQPWVQNEHLFTKLDLGMYTNRKIRDYQSGAFDTGRWREIADETTWKQFLEQAALYYNCEYEIDPETATFKMHQRNQTPTSFRDIDPMIVSDQEYRIQIVSQDTFDYLYCFAYHDTLNKTPQFLRWKSDPGYRLPSQGGIEYKMSAVLNVNGKEIETSPGPPTDVLYPPSGTPEYGWGAVLRIPSCYATTLRRKIYYRDVYAKYGFKRIDTIEGNDQIDVVYGVDSRWYNNNPPTYNKFLVNAWHRYDEATGEWGDPILDIDEPEPPSGSIKDVRPMLQFHEIDNPKNVLPYDTETVFQFFRYDLTNEMVHTQYRDLFISKPLVEVKVEGIDWKVGDGVTATRIPGILKAPGKTVFYGRVKRATIDPMNETTVLGVVPI